MPVGFCIAMIATASGIGGAALFTPFLFIVMDLPARIAVAAGLFIELFGFSSGLIGFARHKLISYEIGIKILYFALPATIVGVHVGKNVDDAVLLQILSIILVLLAILLLRPDHEVRVKHVKHGKDKTNFKIPEIGVDARLLSSVGGLLAGMVSSGIGEMNDYVLMKKYKMKGAIAAGTSVFVVAITVLIGSMTHAYVFFQEGTYLFAQLGQILLFAVPGVVLGAQVGVRVSQKIPEAYRKRFIASIFLAVAVVTIISIPF